MDFILRKESQFQNVEPNFWPVEEGDGDSIFSDIVEPDLLDGEEEIQCSQKFLADINEVKEPIMESVFFCGSQYFTTNQICNLKSLQSDKKTNETGSGDITGKTQELTSENFHFVIKGPFFDLPQKAWQLINEQKGIFELYEWQKECLRLPAIQQRRNLLYALPTSGGKTLVAEILMLREIICREKNVIFILPYISIVQEKVSSMSAYALAFNFLVEEYAGGKGRCPPLKRKTRKTLFISSIEKGAILFDSLVEANRANEIGMVVVDELHLLGESGRGAILETFLTKVMFLKVNIQIIGMSATIGNISDISKFLNSDVYVRAFRPIELKEHIKCGNDILEINSRGKNLDDIFVYQRTVNFKYSAKVKKVDPDHLGGLVCEITPEASCLIFCSTRRNCENVAVLLSKILPRKRYVEHRQNEKTTLMDVLQKSCGILSPILKETIPYGIAFHHSGLTTDERKLLENAYRFGTICVICCTSTLAAGVNLPAKRVIIRAPFVGNKFMTLCQYKQMIGRAGRAGLRDAGESFLICSAKENYQVGQMFFSPMDKIISSLDLHDCIGLQSLIMSSIGLTISSCFKDLLELCSLSLFAIQANERDISLVALISNILRDMFKHKVLEVSDMNFESSQNSDIITTQEISNNPQGINYKTYVLRRSTKFNLTSIGRAAFKSGIDYCKVELICDELKMAQKALVLTSYAHLVYLVVIFNMSDESITPDPRILFEQYNRLDEKTRDFVKVLGITETHMIKMARTLSLKGPMENTLAKLFKTFILIDILNLMPVHEVATKYSLERGSLQNLITQSISAASTMIRLCEEIQEFWCFKPLFEKLLVKLDYCCSTELKSLLEIPSVKIYRAKQLFTAGYRSIEDVAKCNTRQLVRSIEHLSVKAACEMISAAKILLLKKLEVLQEETDYLMECLNS